MRRSTVWALFVAVLIGATLVRLPGRGHLLDGSEVDYVLAARRGFLTNYLDLGSRSIREYMAAGLSMVGLTEGGGDTDLWQRDVMASDIAAYRHYHPPVFIYVLHAVERLAGDSEVALRLVPITFAVATVAALFAGCALLIPVRGRQIGLVAAAILSALSLHVSESTVIGWHVPYTCLATLSLFAMGHFMVRPSVWALVAATTASTVAFMTLEHAVFLYLTLLVVLVVTGAPWLHVSRSGWCVHRGVFVAIGAALLTMLVTWPASLIKLSIVKNLGVHAYYSRELELSPRFYDIYLTLVERYPAMMGMAAITAVVSIARRSSLPRAVLPFAIYAAAMCVLQLGNQNLKPLYYVSLLPPLAVLSAVWIVDALGATTVRWRVAGQVATVVVVIALVVDLGRTLTAQGRSHLQAELVDRLARVDGVVGARVLTWPAGSHAAQMLAFYMPDTQFVRVVEEPRAVRTMTDAVGRGVFDFVVVDTASRERGSDVPPGLQMNYRRLFAITDEADLDAFEVWRRR